MCFTFAGRIQTRLISLVGPLLLMGAAAAVRGDAGPLRMVALMAATGLALDAGIYRWLIGYQPRWLTILLGALEFVLLFGLMHELVWRPYLLMPPDYYLAPERAWRADAGAALELYVPAWLLAWLTTHALLPWAAPRWAEDGGELRVKTPNAERRTLNAERRTPNAEKVTDRSLWSL
jgi:hypothetical protein